MPRTTRATLQRQRVQAALHAPSRQAPNAIRDRSFRDRRTDFGLCDYGFVPLFCPTSQTASLLGRARLYPLVIASAAKQSRIVPRRDTGLLRCARNDDEAAEVRQTPASSGKSQRRHWRRNDCAIPPIYPDASDCWPRPPADIPRTPFLLCMGLFSIFFVWHPPKSKEKARPRERGRAIQSDSLVGDQPRVRERIMKLS